MVISSLSGKISFRVRVERNEILNLNIISPSPSMLFERIYEAYLAVCMWQRTAKGCCIRPGLVSILSDFSFYDFMEYSDIIRLICELDY